MRRGHYHDVNLNLIEFSSVVNSAESYHLWQHRAFFNLFFELIGSCHIIAVRIKNVKDEFFDNFFMCHSMNKKICMNNVFILFILAILKEKHSFESRIDIFIILSV